MTFVSQQLPYNHLNLVCQVVVYVEIKQYRHRIFDQGMTIVFARSRDRIMVQTPPASLTRLFVTVFCPYLTNHTSSG